MLGADGAWKLKEPLKKNGAADKNRQPKKKSALTKYLRRVGLQKSPCLSQILKDIHVNKLTFFKGLSLSKLLCSGVALTSDETSEVSPM